MEYIREELVCFSMGMSTKMHMKFGFVNIAGGAYTDVTAQTQRISWHQQHKQLAGNMAATTLLTTSYRRAVTQSCFLTDAFLLWCMYLIWLLVCWVLLLQQRSINDGNSTALPELRTTSSFLGEPGDNTSSRAALYRHFSPFWQ